jgi:hypothetical protein
MRPTREEVDFHYLPQYDEAVKMCPGLRSRLELALRTRGVKPETQIIYGHNRGWWVDAGSLRLSWLNCGPGPKFNVSVLGSDLLVPEKRITSLLDALFGPPKLRSI